MDQVLKISLNQSHYKTYYTSYFNTKEIIKSPKILITQKLEIDNNKVVSIGGSSNKSFHY